MFDKIIAMLLSHKLKNMAIFLFSIPFWGKCFKNNFRQSDQIPSQNEDVINLICSSHWKRRVMTATFIQFLCVAC